MKFDDLYNELMFENAEESDPLFNKILDILETLRVKNPSALPKISKRLQELLASLEYTPATKTYKVPEDPEDASWIVSAKG